MRSPGRRFGVPLQISIAALFFGSIGGLVLAVVMAGNIGAPRWLVGGARLFATVCRSVPELLWALVFVAVDRISRFLRRRMGAAARQRQFPRPPSGHPYLRTLLFKRYLE